MREPEDLYIDYKKDITLKVSKCVNIGASFTLTSLDKMGISKYLRYISKSAQIHKIYFPTTKIIYLDLNKLIDYKSDTIVTFITSELSCEPTLKSILSDFLNNFNKVLFLIDHAEVLENLNAPSINVLRHLDDYFKETLVLCLANDIKKYDTLKLKKILDICSVNIQMSRSSKVEFYKCLDIKFSKYNITFSDVEKEFIYTKSKALPKYIKKSAIQKSLNLPLADIFDTLNLSTSTNNFSENLNSLDSLKDYSSSTHNISSEESFLNSTSINLPFLRKLLTPKEFILLQLLLKKNGAIVDRNALAEILNPETMGSGVSNESID